MCLREKTSQIAKVQKKTENIGGDFSVFRDRAGWFAQKETAHSFFPELVTNDYPVGDLCARCGDAQEVDTRRKMGEGECFFLTLGNLLQIALERHPSIEGEE